MDYTPSSRDIFPGFYESILLNSESESDYNRDEQFSDPDNYVERELDYNSFTKEVCEEITSLIGKILDANAEFREMYSPREYNFVTDQLTIEIDIDPERIKSEILASEDLSKGFDKYLHAHYTSRDGFWSFVENNIQDYFRKGEHTDVMIDYYLLTKIYEDEDVVKCQRQAKKSDYYCQLWEIADNALYNNMKEIPINQ